MWCNQFFFWIRVNSLIQSQMVDSAVWKWAESIGADRSVRNENKLEWTKSARCDALNAIRNTIVEAYINDPDDTINWPWWAEAGKADCRLDRLLNASRIHWMQPKLIHWSKSAHVAHQPQLWPAFIVIHAGCWTFISINTEIRENLQFHRSVGCLE